MGQPVSVRDLSTSNRKSTLTASPAKGKHGSWKCKVEEVPRPGLAGSRFTGCQQDLFFSLAQCLLPFSAVPRSGRMAMGPPEATFLQREMQLIFILTFPAEVLRFAVIGLSRVPCWWGVMGLGLHPGMCGNKMVTPRAWSHCRRPGLELNCLTSYLISQLCDLEQGP